MSKYFAPKEFQACVPSCSIEQMDAGFLELLDRVREAAGIPLVLKVVFRVLEPADLRKQAAERLWPVEDQLDVEAALFVGFGDEFPERCQYIARERLVSIRADRMSELECAKSIHNHISLTVVLGRWTSRCPFAFIIL